MLTGDLQQSLPSYPHSGIFVSSLQKLLPTKGWNPAAHSKREVMKNKDSATITLLR